VGRGEETVSGNLTENAPHSTVGTFALQFASQRFPFFEYKGRVIRLESRLIFEWEGWSTAGPLGGDR
jgi:hypothetical protein